MRIISFKLVSLVALVVAVAGCTVKDVDAPALAGPSTFGYSILLTSNTDTLTKDGVSTATIQITARNPDGQEVTGRPLRAAIVVDGVVQDYGMLSTKTPVTGGTLRYTAPAGSALAMGNTAETVTITVTPTDTGDFRSEFPRQIDLRLVPQGVILPSNPNLVAAFTFTPTAPQSFQIVSFDATTSTNGGVSCGQACSYSWNFGDGTTGTGQTTTHQFRSVSLFPVTLTVTDSRGATAMSTQSINVATPTPPTVSFTVSPTPAPTNVDVFFNAAASRPASGRTIVSYAWNFGDGTTGGGVTTTHRYSGVGSYSVTLTVTDDANAVGQSTQTLSVGGISSQATAALVVTPSAPKPGQRVALDASGSTPSTGAVITNYRFDYGDGAIEDSNNPVQSRTYVAGQYVASVQITDSNGKTSTKVVSFTVEP